MKPFKEWKAYQLKSSEGN